LNDRLLALLIAGTFLLAALTALASEPPKRSRGAGAGGVHFVGNDTCLECHADQAKRWQGSHHDLAMQPVNASTVLGDFSGALFDHRGLVSRFYRDADRFMVQTEGPDGKLADYEVLYTFGVDPLQQYLIAFPGGRLQALGIAWDTRQKRWFHLYPDEPMRHDDPLHWTGRYQSWNAMCAECHSTDLRKRYDPESDTYATTWAEIDVSCQACHGPGADHVEWARKAGPGARVGAGIDDGLRVQMKGASAQQEVESCARCHSRRHRIAGEDVHGRSFYDDFMPTPLSEGLYFADGQIEDEVYVLGSFLQSRMHRAGVRCGDCHDPHSLGLRAEGNALCTRCHQATPDASLTARLPVLRPGLYDSAEHHHHAEGSKGSLCVDCHMPSRTYMVVDPRRDHSLRVPRPDLSARLGVPNACNDCHGDQPASWAAARVVEWWGPTRTRGADFASTIHDGRAGAPGAQAALTRLAASGQESAIVRATAVALLTRYGASASSALALATRDEDPLVRAAAAAATGRLPAESRSATLVPLLRDPIRGVRVEAARGLAELPPGAIAEADRAAFSAALAEYADSQLASSDLPAGRLNLAVLYTARGRYEEAIATYRRITEMDPLFLPAWANLAHLYDALEQPAEAEQTLREAIALLPDEGELHYSLGLLLAQQGRMVEATASLRQAAERMPDRARVQYNLGLAEQGLGRNAQAEQALARAAQLEPRDPAIVHAQVVLYAQQGRWDEALPLARRLVELTQGAPGAVGLLRRVEAEAGR
jgi:predicted CXXCH cytochrome family protein